MNQINSPETEQDAGTENRGYIRSHSDHHLPISKAKERMSIRSLPRTTSAAASTFPATVLANQRVLSPPIPVRSSKKELVQKQESLVDPTSDRIGTVLVWQNLTVSTRENKRKEFFQRLKSSKNFVPKRKDLLHNLSGAITGGLWAVMGKLISFPDHHDICFSSLHRCFRFR